MNEPRRPRWQTEMDLIRAATKLSDVELADIYNAHYRTFQPSPLTDKFAARLQTALAARK